MGGLKIMDSVKITLSQEELDWCLKAAEDLVAHYKKRGVNGSGIYHHNRVDSNLVGLKSEVGTKKWLLNHISKEDLTFHFEDYYTPNTKGDILAYSIPLEVKGLRPHHWDKFQRCIPPSQLKKYVKNNAIVVWTTATGDIDNQTVELKGWNYCWEVDKYGEFRQTICANIWLKDNDKMRGMDTFITELNKCSEQWSVIIG
jgi:hypothetical protein